MRACPVAYRLYLPQACASVTARRKKARVPDEVVFQIKPEIALDQIRAACASLLPRGVVLMDAGYGTHIDLRTAITALELAYVAGILSNTTVWRPALCPCRPSLTSRASAGRSNSFAAMPSTCRSRSTTLPSAFRPRRGGRSLRAREPMRPSNRVLRRCAFASPIATGSAICIVMPSAAPARSRSPSPAGSARASASTRGCRSRSSFRPSARRRSPAPSMRRP